MNQTHIHLLITHLPIFGSMLGGIVLAHGLWTKSNQTIIAAYYVLIISSLGAGIAYLTGEGAEESVEHLQGVAKANIEQHKDSAVFALIALIILGLASVLGLFISLRKMQLTRTTAFVILLISIISFGLVARTGYLGGQIRHTELANGVPNNSENSDKDSDD